MLAATLIFTGCDDENDPGKKGAPKGGGNPQMFAAVINEGEAMKAENYGGKTKWVADEEVNVNGTVMNVRPNATDPTTAVLLIDEENGMPDLTSGLIKAIFPAEFASGGKDDPIKGTFAPYLLPERGEADAEKLDGILPMYAQGTEQALDFKNLCGLLEVQIKAARYNVYPKVESITLQDGKAPLSGPFTVDAGGSAVITQDEGLDYAEIDCDGKKISANQTSFYIALAPGTYEDLTVIVKADDRPAYWRMKLEKPLTIERAKKTSLLLENVNLAPDGTTGRAFQINANGDMVFFAKGNLWADATNPDYPVYHLENSQIAYPTELKTSHMAHFFWTSQAGAAALMKEPEDLLKAEYGKTHFVDATKPSLIVKGYEETPWRMLGYDEWVYLRKASEDICTIVPDAYVAGVKHCLILGPRKVAIKSSYTADEWEKAEANGVVCLPPAGFRDNGQLREQGNWGWYWTGTPDENKGKYDKAYMAYFGNLVGSPSISRQAAETIRLVTPVIPQD